MCFMTKCPYVPPHEWAVDFPHLMLRSPRGAGQEDGTGFVARQLAETDRMAAGSAPSSPGLANWASTTRHSVATRRAMETAGRHPSRRASAELSPAETFELRAAREGRAGQRRRRPPSASARPCSIATCFVNFNNTDIGAAARAVLAQERRRDRGGLSRLLRHAASWSWATSSARRGCRAPGVGDAAAPWIDEGYDVIALTPSCALMLKFEWPLILPEDR